VETPPSRVLIVAEGDAKRTCGSAAFGRGGGVRSLGTGGVFRFARVAPDMGRAIGVGDDDGTVKRGIVSPPRSERFRLRATNIPMSMNAARSDRMMSVIMTLPPNRSSMSELVWAASMTYRTPPGDAAVAYRS
jgi:hypothetical protein